MRYVCPYFFCDFIFVATFDSDEKNDWTKSDLQATSKRQSVNTFPYQNPYQSIYGQKWIFDESNATQLTDNSKKKSMESCWKWMCVVHEQRNVFFVLSQLLFTKLSLKIHRKLFTSNGLRQREEIKSEKSEGLEILRHPLRVIIHRTDTHSTVIVCARVWIANALMCIA